MDPIDIVPTLLVLSFIVPTEKLIEGNKSYIIDGKSFKPILMNDSKKTHRDWILGMGGKNSHA